MYNYFRGEYVITISYEMIEAHKRSMKNRQLRIDPDLIHFTPRDYKRKQLH